MNGVTNQEIIDEYMSFISDSKREAFIVFSDANKETLQSLLNDEPNDELAETLQNLIKEK